MTIARAIAFLTGSVLVVYAAYRITSWVGALAAVGLLLIWASGEGE